jgi:hypothetical protein
MEGERPWSGVCVGLRGRGRVLCSLVLALKMSENGGNGDGWFGRRRGEESLRAEGAGLFGRE